MAQTATLQRPRARRVAVPAETVRQAICTKTCPICHCRFIARDSLAEFEIFCRECGD